MVDAGLHDGQTYEYVHNVLLDIRDEMFPNHYIHDFQKKEAVKAVQSTEHCD